jgi:hypothetical protein
MSFNVFKRWKSERKDDDDGNDNISQRKVTVQLMMINFIFKVRKVHKNIFCWDFQSHYGMELIFFFEIYELFFGNHKI